MYHLVHLAHPAAGTLPWAHPVHPAHPAAGEASQNTFMVNNYYYGNMILINNIYSRPDAPDVPDAPRAACPRPDEPDAPDAPRAACPRPDAVDVPDAPRAACLRPDVPDVPDAPRAACPRGLAAGYTFAARRVYPYSGAYRGIYLLSLKLLFLAIASPSLNE